MLPKFKSGMRGNMIWLINKPPTWNMGSFMHLLTQIALEAYVLNFSGRVTMPSVKNFQLINPDDGKHL